MSKTAEIDYAELVIEDYRQAPSGKGPLASEWEDKPHRLVYDLCSAITSLIKERDELREALKPFAAIPRVLTTARHRRRNQRDAHRGDTGAHLGYGQPDTKTREE